MALQAPLGVSFHPLTFHGEICIKVCSMMHAIYDAQCKSLKTDCESTAAQVATQSLMTIPHNAASGAILKS